MPKKIACPKCQVSLSITSKMAGKKGKCPKCAAVFKVPATLRQRHEQASGIQATTQSGASASEPTRTAAVDASPTKPKLVPARSPQYRAKLLAAFEEPIDKVRKSFLYPLAALMVAGMMVLLPVLYIGLIGLMGFAVYYHLANNQWLMALNVGFRGRALMGLAYIAPLIVGVIAVLFMLKPLFARPSKRSRLRSLTRGGEPLLFEFVEHICDSVGAPQPTRIDVDCQMNASAGFRRGLLSMIGSDLVLTIGIPLAAGLSLRQFAGVLAHEFGHFSQGLGMRLSFIIRAVNSWFARVVYDRDEWDMYLVEATSETDFRIGWILAVAQVFVWLSRQVLWVLMMVGHLVSGILLRQMEYDADMYEARLVGNRVFEETSNRLRLLSVSYELAQRGAYQLFQRGTLADDFAALTLHQLERLPTKVREHVATMNRRTGIFDTHPSHQDRVAHVNKEDNPGVFRIDGRTRDLFVHFDAIAKNVTWDFYCEVIGRVKHDALVPVTQLLGEEKAPRNHPDLPPIPFDGNDRIPFDE